MYLSQTRFLNGSFATFPASDRPGGGGTAAAMAAAFDAERRAGRRVRAVVLCSPNNPTGRCFDSAEAGRICAQLDAELDAGEDFVVLLDEVYVGITRAQHVSLLGAASVGLRRRMCLVLSGSKGLGAMPGARIAWVTCLDAELVRNMATCQSNLCVALALARVLAPISLARALPPAPRVSTLDRPPSLPFHFISFRFVSL